MFPPAYTHPTNLKIHKQDHAGDGSGKGGRPFLCHDCGKSFRTANRLKLHRAVHTGEKARECLDCGRRFTDNSKVKRHQSLHCKMAKERRLGIPRIEEPAGSDVANGSSTSDSAKNGADEWKFLNVFELRKIDDFALVFRSVHLFAESFVYHFACVGLFWFKRWNLHCADAVLMTTLFSGNLWCLIL